MSASNGHIRKKVDGIKLYTNELYYKSFPGQPTTNLLPTAETNSDFSVRLGGSTNGFYRIYKDKDPNLQGMYKSLATGHMSENDVVYKYNFTGPSNRLMGMHTFSASSSSGSGPHDSLKLRIGQEYIFSCEVFISKRHSRTSGLGSVISIKATGQDGKYYGFYDFSKTGTWQVVTIPFTPKLESLIVATAGTAGSSGSSGSSGTGTSGTSGVSGKIQSTMPHTAYFWAHEGTTNGASGKGERLRGWALYKNPQLEKGSLRTQFTRFDSPRDNAASLKDISGNKNSFSVYGMSFSDEALPLYTKDSYANLGLSATKSGSSSSLTAGSSNKKTYEFWFKASSLSEGISTLLYSDKSEGSSFTNNSNKSRKQHIYIDNGKVYCDFYNEFGFSSTVFTTDSVIEDSKITHLVVSVDMTKSSNKVKFFINGNIRDCKAVSNLLPPTNISLYSFPNVGSTLEFASSRSTYLLSDGGLEVEKAVNQGGFSKGNTVNYKVSAYNENGESAASGLKKVITNKQNSAISVSWSNIKEAKGFYVYKSLSSISEFSEGSLLIKTMNPFYGEDSTDLISFKDDNSIILKEGSPKSISTFSKYKINNTDFFDGSDLKGSIGDFPQLDKTTTNTNLEGKIYKTALYSKTFSRNDALYSYIEGSRDFDLVNNVASYEFSVSAGESIGGFGGGY